VIEVMRPHDPSGARAAYLPIRLGCRLGPVALGDKAHWVRIVPDQVTGRRIWNRPH
jgi:hypothetical protein